MFVASWSVCYDADTDAEMDLEHHSTRTWSSPETALRMAVVDWRCWFVELGGDWNAEEWDWVYQQYSADFEDFPPRNPEQVKRFWKAYHERDLPGEDVPRIEFRIYEMVPVRT